MTMVLLLYYLIGFMAMSQPAIFATGESGEAGSALGGGPVPEAGNGEGDRFQGSALTAEIAVQYWRQLQAHMRQERPFLDNRLRIADLATQVDMPVHYLSQTINRHAGQSFFDFVNGYRVDAARRMLEEGEKPVATIAFDAGFNSESAFYRQFKKVTGMTPRQYRRHPLAGMASH
jgi:AraC-like DNA-binding protein